MNLKAGTAILVLTALSVAFPSFAQTHRKPTQRDFNKGVRHKLKSLEATTQAQNAKIDQLAAAQAEADQKLADEKAKVIEAQEKLTAMEKTQAANKTDAVTAVASLDQRTQGNLHHIGDLMSYTAWGCLGLILIAVAVLLMVISHRRPVVVEKRIEEEPVQTREPSPYIGRDDTMHSFVPGPPPPSPISIRKEEPKEEEVVEVPAQEILRDDPFPREIKDYAKRHPTLTEFPVAIQANPSDPRTLRTGRVIVSPARKLEVEFIGPGGIHTSTLDNRRRTVARAYPAHATTLPLTEASPNYKQ